MRDRFVPQVVTGTLIVLGLAGCGRNEAQPSKVHLAVGVRPAGLVLQEGEGERRVRRTVGKGPFILKVDRRNGNSPDLVMGYEEIAPGAEIQPHTHLIADEILFIHRGAGVATLDGRESAIRSGATIYIPHNVQVSVRNTGSEPLGVAFIFSKPGFEELMRDNSVLEGQPVTPISPHEHEQIRQRHSWHTIYPR
jgi:mannose-6-phosphate isomerase-like protein (cupin superfamily)